MSEFNESLGFLTLKKTVHERVWLIVKDKFTETEKTLKILAEEYPEEYQKFYYMTNGAIIDETLRLILMVNFTYNFTFGKFHSMRLVYGLPPDTVEEIEGKWHIKYDNLTDWLIRTYLPISFKKQIWIWNGERWKEDTGEIENAISYILKSYGLSNKHKIKDTVNEITMRIHWFCFIDEFPFNKLGREYLPLMNGVLYHGDDKVLLPNGPAFGHTYRIPVKYDPNADCLKIKKFISEVVAEENQALLYEIPALAIMLNEWAQVAFMLVGQGQNGKSTYLKILERFLGEENISNISLQELCGDRFKAAELLGKLANIYADLPKNPIKYTGKFKILTGGDRITVEKKFKDPFSFVNKALLIFSANELPQVSDQTYAFWRRWIIIEFPNQFPKNDELIDELTTEEELSGFLNEVLLAKTRIEIKGVTKTKTTERIMEEWMKRANSVYAFIQDRIERDIHSYETKDAVYAAYLEYCEENDLNAVPKNKFSPEFERLARARPTHKTIGGKRVRAWQGVKLKWDTPKEEGTLNDFDDNDNLTELLDEW